MRFRFAALLVLIAAPALADNAAIAELPPHVSHRPCELLVVGYENESTWVLSQGVLKPFHRR